MKSNKPKQNGGKPNNGVITDNRFIHAQNDPKFKMYRRKDNAVQLDNRFGDLMKSNGSFTSDAPIDEYGRKIIKNKIDKSIKKTYVLEEEKNKEDIKIEKQPTKKEINNNKKTNNNKKKPVVESESESESEEEEVEEEEEEEESINSDIETEEKVIEYGGFEYNSDTESSDAEEFQGDDIEEEEIEEEEDVPRGDASKRFAVLNCDWDNITSKQLFILLNSFVPSGGHIERITIYPSDFGLEQMAREKSLGPNKDIWDSNSIGDGGNKSITNNSGLKESSLSYDKQEDAESLDGKGFNLEKLRQYELSKLKYYYAVVECNSIETASKIYDECEGMEIEDTANVLDLRFIPDDQKFTNTPRDTCTELPATSDENGGFGFQTSILKGTAVDFTWDIDKTRKKLLTKNFSKFDAREEDLRAYLADPTSSEESSSDDDYSVDQSNSNNNNKNNKQSDKNSKRLALRNKYKSLLLDGIEEEEEKDDIQITFNSAFSETLKQQKQQNSDNESDDDGLSIKFSDQEIGSSDEEEEEESDKEGIINNDSDSADDESSENDEDKDENEDEEEEDDDNLLNGSDSETPDWAKDLKSDSEDDTVQEMVINTSLNNVGKKLLKEKEKRENGNVFTDYLEKKKEKKAQKKREKRIEIEKLIKEKEEKEKQQKKNKSKGRITEEEKKEKAELELLLMEDDLSKNKGYTKKQLEREAKMNTIDPIERKKLEKKLKKKNQKMEVKDDKHLIDLQGFKMDTKDERINKIFTNPDFAIDPTDPKFKRTTGMVELLSEKKNRRQVEKEKEEKEILERRNKLNSTTATSTATSTTSKSSLSEMAQNIKRKAEEQKNKEISKKFKK
ncbi:hypothetical protein ACTA71_011088 [Dictyostelium dimigraforme]